VPRRREAEGGMGSVVSAGEGLFQAGGERKNTVEREANTQCDGCL